MLSFDVSKWKKYEIKSSFIWVAIQIHISIHRYFEDVYMYLYFYILRFENIVHLTHYYNIKPYTKYLIILTIDEFLKNSRKL